MDADIVVLVRNLVAKYGAAAAARMLRMPRTTIVSIASGSPNTREGSLVLAQQRWGEMGEMPAAARTGSRIGD
jgi:hypothetical protein